MNTKNAIGVVPINPQILCFMFFILILCSYIVQPLMQPLMQPAYSIISSNLNPFATSFICSMEKEKESYFKDSIFIGSVTNDTGFTKHILYYSSDIFHLTPK